MLFVISSKLQNNFCILHTKYKHSMMQVFKYCNHLISTEPDVLPTDLPMYTKKLEMIVLNKKTGASFDLYGNFRECCN